LINKGIIPVFEPSDSTAETLALELPSNLGNTVLYPSSAIAENTLEKGLQSRNFKVTRLNTYNTVPAVWTSEQEALAKSVDIVTFGSPSAVKTWAEKVGTDFTAVVIGPTSFKSAEKLGYQKVIAPENGSKGIEAWAQAIANAADQLIDKN
jgi:uroporphyrinogen-III synthase